MTSIYHLISLISSLTIQQRLSSFLLEVASIVSRMSFVAPRIIPNASSQNSYSTWWNLNLKSVFILKIDWVIDASFSSISCLNRLRTIRNISLLSSSLGEDDSSGISSFSFFLLSSWSKGDFGIGVHFDHIYWVRSTFFK